MNSRILASVALVLSTIGLAACNNQNAEEVAEAPEGITGLTIENARMILPAVPANPGVVYFDLSYGGDTPQTLSAVDVQGAERAMMHDNVKDGDAMKMVPLMPVELTKGKSVSFAAGGKHIMAMGISPELTAGGTTEVTLIFATGDKQTVDADISAPGDAR